MTTTTATTTSINSTRLPPPLSADLDNPYLMLEKTWQITKRRNNQQTDARCGNDFSAVGEMGHMDELDLPSTNIRPVSPISIGGSSCASSDQQRRIDNVKRLNLSAICISNILMLEDRHLPSIFIRMYEQCLLINEQDEENAENKTRLRLLNYLIQRWHETRSRLNFYRDVMRVVGALAKPLIGDHLNIAVEATKINQQHVMSELMRNLRSETNGRTLGEYLESFSQSVFASKFTFNDMALELFTRNEVLSYERSRDGERSGVGGMINDLVAHPLTMYGKRVVFVLLQAMCRLKLNIPTTVSNKLFAPSVPSWMEEDTETGMINCDEATKRRIAEAKDNITRMLLHRRDKLAQSATEKKERESASICHRRQQQLSIDNETSLGARNPGGSPPLVQSSSSTFGKTDKANVFHEHSAPFSSSTTSSSSSSVSTEVDDNSKVERYLERRALAMKDNDATDGDGEDCGDTCPLDDELRTVDTESFIAYPAVSEKVQARSLSALRHMEATVQRVKDADQLQRSMSVVDDRPMSQAASIEPLATIANPTSRKKNFIASCPVSDMELLRTLQQNFPHHVTSAVSFDDVVVADGSVDSSRLAKRIRLSGDVDVDTEGMLSPFDNNDDHSDHLASRTSFADDEVPPPSVDVNNDRNSVSNSTLSASTTVGNIRSNDRDLDFLARSGYDDELGLQLDNLDNMLESDQTYLDEQQHAVIDERAMKKSLASSSSSSSIVPNKKVTTTATINLSDDDRATDNFDDLL